MAALTQKMINVLKALNKGYPVIAPWSNRELTALEQCKFVTARYAMSAAGKSHTSKVWEITKEGQTFLVEERGGQ